jgi:hypothetical protein
LLLLLKTHLLLLLKQALRFFGCVVLHGDLSIPGLGLFLSGLGPRVIEALNCLFEGKASAYE